MRDILALTIEKIALVGASGLLLLILALLAFLLRRFMPRRLKPDRFKQNWIDLQKLLVHKEAWAEAIIKADDLLDKALKKRSFRGKNPGERLVNAQRIFTNNDAVWFAHKLRNTLEQKPNLRLTREDVKEALLSIGQALKDLGAL